VRPEGCLVFFLVLLHRLLLARVLTILLGFNALALDSIAFDCFDVDLHVVSHGPLRAPKDLSNKYVNEFVVNILWDVTLMFK